VSDPPGVVTVTVTVPDPAGAVVLIAVSVFAVIAAGEPPKVTLVAPSRSVPVMFTRVPPDSGPAGGEMPVISGAPRYV
jgi:hypothetical protein